MDSQELNNEHMNADAATIHIIRLALYFKE